jgi:hypothetical protein
MQHLEVSCAVRPIYGSLGAKGLNIIYKYTVTIYQIKHISYSNLHLHVSALNQGIVTLYKFIIQCNVQLLQHHIHCNSGAANCQHERNIPSAVCWAPDEDKQVTLGTYRGL